MIKCIIVDDEQHAIDILAHYASQTPVLDLAGCFTNPIDALQVLAQQKIDLVFLDIQMPELDGLEATRQISSMQAAARQTRLRIVALTAHAMKSDRDQCLAAGMDEFLSKPIVPTELDAILAAFSPARAAEDSLSGHVIETRR